MSLQLEVLGAAGRDNALLVTVNSGQYERKLLFDCGDGCLWQLPFGAVQDIDHLFFSHLHMDHIGGFDTFFRCTFGRTTKPNHIWGPPQTAAILQHRFQGFRWNLVAGQQVSWFVHDLDAERVTTHRYELAECFAQDHAESDQPYQQVFLREPGHTVEAWLMDHSTPSVAYVVRETPSLNIDTAKLAAMGLRPGPWLQKVRGPRATAGEVVEINGAPRSVVELQDTLLIETPRDACGYLTDFLLDDAAIARLAPVLQGVRTIVCESQYRHADEALASRNFHMTATRAAWLAREAAAGELVLFHLSDRYQPDDWRQMLAEAQAIFPATTYPPHWQLSVG